MSDTIYRDDAIEVVYRLVEELPPKSILSKEPNKIYPPDVVKALSALPSAEVVSREEYDVLYKKWVEAEQMVDYYDIDGDDEMAIEAQSAEAALQLNRIDTLIIANALRYLINDEERHELDRATAESLRERILKYGASMCKNSEDK